MILPTKQGDIKAIAHRADVYGPYKSSPTWSHSEQTVTPEGAMALTAVYGGVMLLAQTLGTMPLQVLDSRKTVGDRLVSAARIASILGTKPNRDMVSPVLWTMMFTHLLLRGNGYLAKLRGEDGYVNELLPLLPQDVTPWRAENGQKLFRVRLLSGNEWYERDFTDEAILHIQGPSLDDPLVGCSPFTIARHRIGTHLAQSEYQATAYASGLLIKGVLSTPNSNITPDVANQMQNRWQDAYGGLRGSGRVPVLHSGITFSPVSLTPEDAQFIQTMKWGHTEIATLLQIPASRLNGDTGSGMRYANMTQDDLYMFKSAQLPRLVYVESALAADADLFGPGAYWYPKFNADAQLRADVETRWRVHRLQREIGATSVNEIRDDEGWSRIGPEGDDYTPLNNVGQEQTIVGDSGESN